MANKHVPEILKRIQEIHDRKSADYASESNAFSNFERAACIAEWFNDPVHKVFATMIGIKLARLAELLNGKRPKNESIDDSFLDQDTYSILFHSYYLDHLINDFTPKTREFHREQDTTLCSMGPDAKD